MLYWSDDTGRASGFLLQRDEPERLVAGGARRVHDLPERVVLDALVGGHGEDAVEGERVALGVTTTGATLLGAGVVKAGGEGTISIEKHPDIGPLEAALQSAKFNVKKSTSSTL